MKITNNKNLPEGIYRAILSSEQRDLDERIDYTVTELLQPNKILLLRKRHDDEIIEDASDMIWKLFGRAVHYILEKGHSDSQVSVEKRFNTLIGDKVISGQVDVMEDDTLLDFKITSIWSYIYGSRLEDYTRQLNYYALLAERNGFKINNLKVIMLFRDWSQGKAEYDKNYPGQVEEVEIERWSNEDIMIDLVAKLDSIESDEVREDDVIEPCSRAERWQRDDKWAVMKKGRKSALNGGICNSEVEAVDFIDNLKGMHDLMRKQYYVEHRMGECVRCSRYCAVGKNGFCNYYNKNIK